MIDKEIIKKFIPTCFREAARRIRNNCLLFAKNLYKKIEGLIIDSNIYLDQEGKSKKTLINTTTRYKLAGINIPITGNEKRIASLHNLHRGERAFIIGNGPSLNLCDLTLLRDELTFGVNNIFLNYEKMGFAPTYYVVEDILLAEDRADQINCYHGPQIKFFGNYLNYCIQDNKDVVWLNVKTDYTNYAGFPKFSRNSARMVWVGGTVSYICMQLAFYMGFQEVYLLGFDHSYIIPNDAKLNDQEKKITSSSDDPNHFNPGYFGKGYRWHDPNVERMEIAYLKAKENFESADRIIYNATVGGNLEVFPRIEYKDLFLEKIK